MKTIVLTGKAVVTGPGSLAYLKSLNYQKAMIITGGGSMIRGGIIRKAEEYLAGEGRQTILFSGIEKNPTIDQVTEGLQVMREFQPDLVLAIGGGSAMDAAKAMVLFYDFPDLNFANVGARMQVGTIPPERKTALICVPSTSGTGAEVTTSAVITDPAQNLKVPLVAACLRPDVAILDGELPLSMPEVVAVETGIDALTHAIEAYTNHYLDTFTKALCEGAIKGILKWLPVSCAEKTLESRQLVHEYQCLAAMAFTNVGLGAVHGIAHAFGGMYNLAHGMTNAIVLPYVMEYNRQDPETVKRYAELSQLLGGEDVVAVVRQFTASLNIPRGFQQLGIPEADYQRDFAVLLDHALMGPTQTNPQPISKDDMEQLLAAVYYGQELTR